MDVLGNDDLSNHLLEFSDDDDDDDEFIPKHRVTQKEPVQSLDIAKRTRAHLNLQDTDWAEIEAALVDFDEEDQPRRDHDTNKDYADFLHTMRNLEDLPEDDDDDSDMDYDPSHDRKKLRRYKEKDTAVLGKLVIPREEVEELLSAPTAVILADDQKRIPKKSMQPDPLDVDLSQLQNFQVKFTEHSVGIDKLLNDSTGEDFMSATQYHTLCILMRFHIQLLLQTHLTCVSHKNHSKHLERVKKLMKSLQSDYQTSKESNKYTIYKPIGLYHIDKYISEALSFNVVETKPNQILPFERKVYSKMHPKLKKMLISKFYNKRLKMFDKMFSFQLDPMLRKPNEYRKFTISEDRLLVHSFRKYGKQSWDQILKHTMPGIKREKLIWHFNTLVISKSRNCVLSYVQSRTIYWPFSGVESNRLIYGVQLYNKDFERISKELLPHRGIDVIASFLRDYHKYISVATDLNSNIALPDTLPEIEYSLEDDALYGLTFFKNIASNAETSGKDEDQFERDSCSSDDEEQNTSRGDAKLDGFEQDSLSSDDDDDDSDNSFEKDDLLTSSDDDDDDDDDDDADDDDDDDDDFFPPVEDDEVEEANVEASNLPSNKESSAAAAAAAAKSSGLENSNVSSDSPPGSVSSTGGVNAVSSDPTAATPSKPAIDEITSDPSSSNFAKVASTAGHSTSRSSSCRSSSNKVSRSSATNAEATSKPSSTSTSILQSQAATSTSSSADVVDKNDDNALSPLPKPNDKLSPAKANKVSSPCTNQSFRDDNFTKETDKVILVTIQQAGGQPTAAIIELLATQLNKSPAQIENRYALLHQRIMEHHANKFKRQKIK